MTDAEALQCLPRALDALAARLTALTATLPPEGREKYADAYAAANILADDVREYPELLGQTERSD